MIKRVLFLLWIIAGYLSAAQVSPVVKSADHDRAVKKIDEMLTAFWSEKAIEENPATSDEKFLRRIYLDVVGRIPTYSEASDFLNDSSKTKRADLIDTLLNSEAYVSSEFNYWADVLRLLTIKTAGRRGGGIYYAEWLKESIRENMHFDDMVKAMLTAKGYPWEDGASGYYMRDLGMPLDNMSNTTRIFLGTRLECAQCHDHPTEKWTRKEYYQLAAFTYPVKTQHKINKMDEFKPLVKYARRNYQSNRRQIFNGPLKSLRWKVEQSERTLRYPDDYQYEDVSPKEQVSPSVIFGDNLDTANLSSSEMVHKFADWLVSKENERFSLVLANRLWKKVFGFGLVEPIDDLTDDTIASHSKLLGFLEKLMKHFDYDMKQFYRVLYNTEVYQREAVVLEEDEFSKYMITGPVFRRMSAEEVWDSYMTLLVADLDDKKSNRNKTAPEAQLKFVYEFIKNNTVEDSLEYLTAAGGMREELQVLTAELKKLKEASGQTMEDADRMSELRAQVQELRDKKKEFQDSFMSQDASMMMDEIKASKKQGNKGWVRASELSSPAPAGHFLSEFGQSDREVVSNADESANALQMLTLMNSSITNKLMSKNSIPAKAVRKMKDPRQKLDYIYLSFLTRYPNEVEREKLLPMMGEKKNTGAERVIWALLNSQQFLFIQ